MVSWLSLHLYKYIPVSIECFGLVVFIMLISIQFNSMVVFAHIYTSFIDSRGTDPSVVYLRSHHVIQDFFLLLPENLSTLRYLIKIWLVRYQFLDCAAFFVHKRFLQTLAFFSANNRKNHWATSYAYLVFFCQVVPLSFCHFVIESFCHTVPPLVQEKQNWYRADLTCSLLSLNENQKN